MTRLKSYKREVAWCILGSVLSMGVKLFLFTADPKLAAALVPAFTGYSLIALPTAMTAFGLHAHHNKDK